MPDLLAMFKRRGYSFITLDQALTDEAYRLPEGYVGRNGFSWIHRWSKPRGCPDAASQTRRSGCATRRTLGSIHGASGNPGTTSGSASHHRVGVAVRDVNDVASSIGLRPTLSNRCPPTTRR